MNRNVLRVLSLLTIAAASQFVTPASASADGIPTCAESAESMCNPPAHYVTCQASCTQTSTGYLLDCLYQPFECRGPNEM